MRSNVQNAHLHDSSRFQGHCAIPGSTFKTDMTFKLHRTPYLELKTTSPNTAASPKQRGWCVNVEQLVRNNSNSKSGNPKPSGLSVDQHAVLKELFELLEEYAPTWYTKEIHDRAVAALMQREHQGAA
jgi:hypothetical protein